MGHMLSILDKMEFLLNLKHKVTFAMCSYVYLEMRQQK